MRRRMRTVGFSACARASSFEWTGDYLQDQASIGLRDRRTRIIDKQDRQSRDAIEVWAARAILTAA